MSLELKDKRGRIGVFHAISGLIAVYRTELNFRIHVWVMILVIFAGLLLGLTRLEWGLVLIVIAMVLISELINTAIEKIIDHVKPEIHPNARLIKDAAAGAVLVSALLSVAIGFIVFLPKVLSLFL